MFLLLIVQRSFSQIEKIKVKKETPVMTNSTESDPVESFIIVEQPPEFPGGISAMLQYIKKNLPATNFECQEFCHGSVFIQFIVAKEGNVCDVKVLKGYEKCPELEKIVIKAIESLPKFKPGYKDGKAVACYFNLPIKIHWQ
jgi:hypothetical protein